MFSIYAYLCDNEGSICVLFSTQTLFVDLVSLLQMIFFGIKNNLNDVHTYLLQSTTEVNEVTPIGMIINEYLD